MNPKNKNASTPVSGPNAAAGASAHANAPADAENRIRINGMQQVLDMLVVADPAFRESLLKRIAERDRELARSLRARLANLG